jgi:hypothetical protein
MLLYNGTYDEALSESDFIIKEKLNYIDIAHLK